MAIFKFRFEALHDLRKRELESVQREMSPVVSKLNIVQNRIDRFSKLINDFQTSKVSLLGQAGGAEYFTQSMGHYRQIINEALRERDIVEGEMEQYRGRLSQAFQRLKAVEIIKENDLKDYKRKQRIKEEKVADELSGRGVRLKMLF